MEQHVQVPTMDLTKVTMEDFGVCTHLQVTSSTCKFTGPSKPTGLVEERLEQAKNELETFKGNNDDWAVERTQERLITLLSLLAEHKAGSDSEAE